MLVRLETALDILEQHNIGFLPMSSKKGAFFVFKYNSLSSKMSRLSKSKKTYEEKAPPEKGCDIVVLSKSDLTLRVHYPEENPKNALDDITRTMNHLELFKGIERENL